MYFIELPTKTEKRLQNETRMSVRLVVHFASNKDCDPSSCRRLRSIFRTVLQRLNNAIVNEGRQGGHILVCDLDMCYLRTSCFPVVMEIITVPH